MGVGGGSGSEGGGGRRGVRRGEWFYVGAWAWHLLRKELGLSASFENAGIEVDREPVVVRAVAQLGVGQFVLRKGLRRNAAGFVGAPAGGGRQG